MMGLSQAESTGTTHECRSWRWATSARADLYALGCVAYYLLTGRLVFEAATALQMIARHIQETAAPPSERTELPVASELDRIVLACLARQPEDRPESALELNRTHQPV